MSVYNEITLNNPWPIEGLADEEQPTPTPTPVLNEEELNPTPILKEKVTILSPETEPNESIKTQNKTTQTTQTQKDKILTATSYSLLLIAAFFAGISGFAIANHLLLGSKISIEVLGMSLGLSFISARLGHSTLKGGDFNPNLGLNLGPFTIST